MKICVRSKFSCVRSYTCIGLLDNLYARENAHSYKREHWCTYIVSAFLSLFLSSSVSISLYLCVSLDHISVIRGLRMEKLNQNFLGIPFETSCVSYCLVHVCYCLFLSVIVSIIIISSSSIMLSLMIIPTMTMSMMMSMTMTIQVKSISV